MKYSRKIWLTACVAFAAVPLAFAIFAITEPSIDWGHCKLTGEDKRGAINACSALLESDLKTKQRARALAIRGYYYNEAGEEAGISLADLDEAIQLNPHHAGAFNNRGLIYSRLQKYDLAIADFTRSIELSPQARTFDSRGRAYFKAGDYASALTDYTRSIELDPKFAKAWRHRGVVRTAMGDYEAARQDLTTALQLRPKYKTARQDLDHLNQLARTPPQTEGPR